MRLIFLVSASLLLSVAGYAQMTGTTGTPFGFTESDLTQIRGALAEVVQAQETDRPIHWSNPDTGKSGVATAKRFYTKDGLPCVDVETVTESPRRANSLPVMLPMCQTSEGWKFAF